jgi:hypothetical protein
MKPIVIDIHAHFTPRSIFERFDEHRAKFHSPAMERA